MIQKKNEKIFLAPENKFINEDKYNAYMEKMKPKNYTKAKKLLCDWTDKKKYLNPYRILNFYVGHGMIFENIHEIISFKQSGSLEKYFNSKTQKRNRAKNDFEKDFHK